MDQGSNAFIMVEPIRPRSVNAGGKGKQHYEAKLKAAANARWNEDRGLLTDRLYARITHVHASSKYAPVDVDNISKWVLDALKDVVITDDKYIRQCLLTRAQIEWEVVDLSFIEDSDVISQVMAHSNSDDVLIIEIGELPEGHPPVRSGPIEAFK